MKILVDRVSETPTPHEFHVSPGWWQELVEQGSPDRDALSEPLSLTVSAHRMGQDLFLAGALDGATEATCSRCLERYRQPLHEGFRLVLEPAGSRVPADPEGAAALVRDGLYLSDELEAGWFQGSEIDLAGFVRELITLLLPVQPLCKEDCRGLCPRCGIDRNHETCECEDGNPASPFAALRKLRDEMSGGNA